MVESLEPSLEVCISSLARRVAIEGSLVKNNLDSDIADSMLAVVVVVVVVGTLEELD